MLHENGISESAIKRGCMPFAVSCAALRTAEPATERGSYMIMRTILREVAATILAAQPIEKPPVGGLSAGAVFPHQGTV